MNCEACAKYVANSEALKCHLCSRKYHYLCINMTSTKFREMNNKNKWQCPSCDNITKRRKGDETPTRKQFEQPLIPEDNPTGPHKLNLPETGDHKDKEPGSTKTDQLTIGSEAITYQQFGLLLDSKLDAKLNILRAELTSEFSLMFGKHIEDFQREITALKNENLKLREDLMSLQQTVSSPREDNLTETVTGLQRQLLARDQELLQNDVEITGIPEYEKESLAHLTITLATKLGMTIEERDIVNTSRVGPKRGLVQGAPPPRPRPIVVRLARQALRDELLKNARVRREATTSGLGLPEHVPKPFFINERLSKENRSLFAKARDAAKEAKWKYAWTKNGRIYCRRKQDVDGIIIRSEEDLVKIKVFVEE